MAKKTNQFTYPPVMDKKFFDKCAKNVTAQQDEFLKARVQATKKAAKEGERAARDMFGLMNVDEAKAAKVAKKHDARLRRLLAGKPPKHHSRVSHNPALYAPYQTENLSEFREGATTLRNSVLSKGTGLAGADVTAIAPWGHIARLATVGQFMAAPSDGTLVVSASADVVYSGAAFSIGSVSESTASIVQRVYELDPFDPMKMVIPQARAGGETFVNIVSSVFSVWGKRQDTYESVSSTLSHPVKAWRLYWLTAGLWQEAWSGGLFGTGGSNVTMHVGPITWWME